MNKLITYSSLALLALSPLLFFPMFSNLFSIPKQLLVVATVLVMFISWAYTVFNQKKLVLPSSRLVLPLLMIIISIIVNLVLVKEGRTEGMVGRGSLYILLSLVSLFSLMGDRSVLRKYFSFTLIGTSTLLALHSILQLTFLNSLEFLPTYMQTQGFTPTGSPLITLSVIVLGLAATLSRLTKKNSDNTEKSFLAFATAVEVIAAVAYISLMLPGQALSPIILPLSASWSITLDAMKSMRSVILGVGLANFTPLYTAVKPLYLNSTVFWNIVPAVSGSELLQILTTTGLIGFISFLALASQIKLHSLNKTENLVALLSFLILVFTPGNLVILSIFFLSLSVSATSEHKSISLPTQPSLVIALSTLLLIIVGAYYSGRYFVAENHMYKAQQALTNNDGESVYSQNLSAIRLVPSLTSYRLSYSQVNLQLASALSQKEDISEDDRANITTLVSQAIRESKTATSLRPNLAGTWTNLGNVYRQLINVAQGSDQLAVENYAQAVALDPANPALRVEYGGIFFQLAQTATVSAQKEELLNRSAQEFSTAIRLKNDYANAYYNLAKAMELGENYPAAYQAMQQVVALIDKNSTDYATAQQELEALKDKLPKQTQDTTQSTPVEPAPSELSEPSPLPSPLPGGPILLPEDLSSPQPSSSPTPLASPEPSATAGSPSSSPEATTTPEPTN